MKTIRNQLSLSIPISNILASAISFSATALQIFRKNPIADNLACFHGREKRNRTLRRNRRRVKVRIRKVAIKGKRIVSGIRCLARRHGRSFPRARARSPRLIACVAIFKRALISADKSRRGWSPDPSTAIVI